jgi:cation transport ATPase
MNVFNAWYYSFSPYVADYERQNPWFQQLVRVLIYPLIGILSVSESSHSIISGEGGAILSGIIASFLIGIVYFAPFSLFIKRIRNCRINYRLTILILVSTTVAVALSTYFGVQIALMISTSVLVLTTIIISSVLFGSIIARLAHSLIVIDYSAKSK